MEIPDEPICVKCGAPAITVSGSITTCDQCGCKSESNTYKDRIAALEKSVKTYESRAVHAEEAAEMWEGARDSERGKKSKAREKVAALEKQVADMDKADKAVSKVMLELEKERDYARDQGERARTHKGIEIQACPLCTYVEGKFIERCEMHRQIKELEKELDERCSPRSSQDCERAAALRGELAEARAETERLIDNVNVLRDQNWELRERLRTDALDRAGGEKT